MTATKDRGAARARLLRVRAIQHRIAAAAAIAADAGVADLIASRARLTALGAGLAPPPGPATGATLAGRGELAARLDAAGTALVPHIDAARQVAALRASERLVRWQREEIARALDRDARKRTRHADARADDAAAASAFRTPTNRGERPCR